MSGPLAIAAVTAALKDLLNNGLLDHAGLSVVGSWAVSAMPPDRIPTGETEPNRLNLFLYQLTPNQGWRNEGLPSRDVVGNRLTNPPLALDLHYILTAYGASDFNAEILLGYAIQLLHETPVLSRAQLRTALGGTPPVGGAVDGSAIPSIFGDLSAIDLADQVESIKITPVTLSGEDLSKLWTAMQARYRPTMAYMVSVVLIQAKRPVQSAPPVLKRGRQDRGPVALATPYPTLTSVQPVASDLLPAMRLGDDVLVTGKNLTATGTRELVFANARSDALQTIALPASSTATEATVHIPSAAEDANAVDRWAIGIYAVSMRVTRPDLPDWRSGGVPIALAPSITLSTVNAAPGDTIAITCAPRIRPDQIADTSVLFGQRSVPPTSIDTPADATQPTAIEFVVPPTAPGVYLVRLRVEGIDSLPVVVSGDPASLDIDAQQQVTVP